MAGTVQGGKKAAISNKERHGEDWYSRIGSIGGKLGTTGGFASPKVCNCPVFIVEHKKANCAGRKGGTVSRGGGRRKLDVYN